MSKGKAPWRRHDGGACPVEQRGQQIQWRVIGTDRVKIVRAGNHDWSMTFEWRFK